MALCDSFKYLSCLFVTNIISSRVHLPCPTSVKLSDYYCTHGALQLSRSFRADTIVAAV